MKSATRSSRETVERKAWLMFFNRVLLEKGLINESEYRQMLVKINKCN